MIEKGLRFRLMQMFGIQPEEAQPVLMLLLYNICAGFVVVYYKTAAMTLFLAHFDVKTLPWVYIASAMVIFIVGWFYVLLENRLSFPHQRIFFALFLFLSVILLYIGLLFDFSNNWLVVLAIWIEVLFTIACLESNLLAGRMFNVRQGKRLFPLITAGTIVATVMGGASIPLLLRIIDINQLLLISICWGAGLMLCLLMFIKKNKRQLLHELSPQKHKDRQQLNKKKSMPMLQDPYLKWLFLFSLLSGFCFFFLNYIFYAELEVAIPEKRELASFLGGYFAISGFLGVIMNSFFSGRLLNRFGMSIGLLLLPLLLILGIIAAATAYIMSALLLAFWLFVLVKLLDGIIRNSIEAPSFQLLHQPLSPDKRSRAQRFRETAVAPLATIGSGILLLLFTSIGSFNIGELSSILLGVVAVWIGVAIVLRRSYKEVLLAMLARRNFSGAGIIFLKDEDSSKLLRQRLSSNVATEVLYCLSILEESGDESLESCLLDLLHTEDQQVLLHVINRIGILSVESALPQLLQLLAHKQSSTITAALLQSICAVGDIIKIFNVVIPWREHPDKKIRAGVIAGMLRSGGLEGILAVGEHLKRLLHSNIVEDRCMAASILGQAGLSNLYQPLVNLINDSEVSVRRAAIKATIELRNNHLIPMLIEQLNDNKVRNIAYRAILSHGEAAFKVIENKWLESSPKLRYRMVWLLARMPHAQLFIWQQLELVYSTGQYSMMFIDALLRALLKNNFHVVDYLQKKTVHNFMQQEIMHATWALACRSQFIKNTKGDSISLLYAALWREFEHSSKRMFQLLALIYPTREIINIQTAYFSPLADRRPQALEALDNLVSSKTMRIILPLLDEINEVSRLSILLTQSHMETIDSDKEALQQILLCPMNTILPWTNSCAIHLLVQLGDKSFVKLIKKQLLHEEPMVQETAAWALIHINNKTPLFETE
ncbi:MAG: HEAT repeat domain-containing protein [Mariprofundales bacterium]